MTLNSSKRCSGHSGRNYATEHEQWPIRRCDLKNLKRNVVLGGDPARNGWNGYGYHHALAVYLGAGTTDRAEGPRGPLFELRAGGFSDSINAPCLLGPVMDVNGDGRDDVIVTSCGVQEWKALSLTNDSSLGDSLSDHVALAVIDIPGVVPPAPWLGAGPLHAERGHDEQLRAGRSVAMDVHGHGLKDFVQKSIATWGPSQMLAYIRTGAAAPRLTAFKDGLGALTEIAYGQLNGAELPESADPLAAFFPTEPRTSEPWRRKWTAHQERRTGQ
jgi:hypothetical protein